VESEGGGLNGSLVVFLVVESKFFVIMGTKKIHIRTGFDGLVDLWEQ
jgi:hypothetical protein